MEIENIQLSPKTQFIIDEFNESMNKYIPKELIDAKF